MSTIKRLISISLAALALSVSAWAGGATRTTLTESSDDPWIDLAVKVHHPRAHAAPIRAAMAVGRVSETFLHWPRILAEALYGERPVVSRKSILALPETPIEDQIYSSHD